MPFLLAFFILLIMQAQASEAFVPIQPSPSPAAASLEEEEDVDLSCEPSGEFVNFVALAVLDKVTARVTRLQAWLNKPLKVGTLEIVVRRAWQSAPEETPETKAYLEVTETKPHTASTSVFSGWMFASSPVVSTFEHPVYDIWVLQGLEGTTAPPEEASPEKFSQLLDHLVDAPAEGDQSKEEESGSL
jgi:hypothetical protein